MIALLDGGGVLVTPPQVSQGIPPLVWGLLFEEVFAPANGNSGSEETSFEPLHVGRFPDLEVHGIVGLIIIIIKIDQIMGPHRALVGGIIEVSNLFKMLPIVGQEGSIYTQYAPGLQGSSRETGQEVSACSMECFHRKGTLRQPSMEAAVMVYIDDKDPIDPGDCLVLGDDQPTDRALKLFQCFRRKHGGKKGA